MTDLNLVSDPNSPLIRSGDYTLISVVNDDLRNYKDISISVVGKYIETKIQNAFMSEIKDQHLISGKATSVFNWKFSIMLQNGLEKIFYWYKTFLIGR